MEAAGQESVITLGIISADLVESRHCITTDAVACALDIVQIPGFYGSDDYRIRQVDARGEAHIATYSNESQIAVLDGFLKLGSGIKRGD